MTDSDKFDGFDASVSDSNKRSGRGLSGIDYWRLCDELSVVQAALLIAGEDPGTSSAYVENWDIENRPEGYEAAKTAISRALANGGIEGQLVPLRDYDINNNVVGDIEGSIDLFASIVNVDSMKGWLRRRGVRSGFFFPATEEAPDYLNPDDPRYAPKLAAAVRAWQAVTDPGGRAPKQALAKWLREHAAEFDMAGDDGNPINQAIEDVSKVANWQPGGGAPKTPGS